MIYVFIFLLFIQLSHIYLLLFFFFNDTATTEIYTLSLHDALPIFLFAGNGEHRQFDVLQPRRGVQLHYRLPAAQDRKSTRLNSSHQIISYAVFCLKKKKYKFRSFLKKYNNGEILNYLESEICLLIA